MLFLLKRGGNGLTPNRRPTWSKSRNYLRKKLFPMAYGCRHENCLGFYLPGNPYVRLSDDTSVRRLMENIGYVDRQNCA
jgi:hypothetical protein